MVKEAAAPPRPRGAGQSSKPMSRISRADPQDLQRLLEMQARKMEHSAVHWSEGNLKYEGVEAPAPFKEALDKALKTEDELLEALKAEAPVRA
ncbi:hypothetical protein [Streptomyces sp. NPDC047803]|uniref:hypothetical protein n=1 Tax=Streptomyces TaxID=1883 RepID=UPI0033FE4B61